MRRHRGIATGLVFVAVAIAATAFAGGPRPWASKVPQEDRVRTNPLPQTPATIGAGGAIYKNTCFPCHGEEAQGDGPAAEFIKPPPKPLIIDGKLSLPDGVAFWVVTNGIDGTGMASLKDALSPEDRWSVISYLHALAKGAAPSASAIVVTTAGKAAAPTAAGGSAGGSGTR